MDSRWLFLPDARSFLEFDKTWPLQEVLFESFYRLGKGARRRAGSSKCTLTKKQTNIQSDHRYNPRYVVVIFCSIIGVYVISLFLG